MEHWRLKMLLNEIEWAMTQAGKRIADAKQRAEEFKGKDYAEGLHDGVEIGEQSALDRLSFIHSTVSRWEKEAAENVS